MMIGLKGLTELDTTDKRLVGIVRCTGDKALIASVSEVAVHPR